MSLNVFPLPDLTPLTQLNVQDNLRINADRWQLAHQYHQHRQNMHYQALWQPGIVYGLGVKVIATPAGVAPHFQTKSWIEVQPGLAIDGEGNPIVVGEETDRTYRIIIPPKNQGMQTLYLVLRHVDPRQLDLPNSTDRFQEQFRFDQRINQLESRDIELCRIQLSPGQESLAMPSQGLRPELGQLDFTQRQFVQLRSQRSLTLGIFPDQQNYVSAFNSLFQGMQVLYPSLQGQIQRVFQVDPALDVLCLDSKMLIQWHQSDTPKYVRLFQSIKDYPGVLLIVTNQVDAALQDSLNQLQRQLTLQPVIVPHRMTQQPFLFGKLPDCSSDTLLQTHGRIVIVPTAMVDNWQGKDQPRQTIRTWHELGINLMYYIWHNSHIRKLSR